ncbi:MAG: hypothetical protein WC156_09355 [Pedobacter sp.]
MNLITRRIAAFGLLLTIMLGMITVCHAHNIIDHDAKTSITVGQALDTENFTHAHGDCCPSAPGKSHSEHNCGHACHGPCHAPLAGSPIVFICARSFTFLHPSEITWYIPKVYLSLFVPPDSVKA